MWRIKIYIKLLAQLIIKHGYVPDGYCLGLIVSLAKDKSGNLSNSNNYRAITIGPVISKVIETVIINLCEDNLNTDDLQFGFKRNIGCTNAVFLCRLTICIFHVLYQLHIA